MTQTNGARTCDTLIKGIVITVDPRRRVFTDGYLAIVDGRDLRALDAALRGRAFPGTLVR